METVYHSGGTLVYNKRNREPQSEITTDTVIRNDRSDCNKN